MAKQKRVNDFLILIIGICLVLLFFILNANLRWFGIEECKRSTFGDQFGAINALFSGFAFVGLIYTIYQQHKDLLLQRDDLKLQREEMANSRKEMEHQTAQFELQNKNIDKQRFDATFFNMLQLQQEIVKGLNYQYTEKTHVTSLEQRVGGKITKEEVVISKEASGIEIFKYCFKRAKIEISIEGKTMLCKGASGAIASVGAVEFEQYYPSSYFDHYFRHLYSIIDFIDSNSAILTRVEQLRYSEFLRSTLSNYELVWLFYVGLFCNEFYKLKHLIEKYSLLRDLPSQLLSLSKENWEIMQSLGIDVDTLKDTSFSGTDYEFYMTNDGNEIYYDVSAFYLENEITAGNSIIDFWNKCFQEFRSAGQAQ